MKFNASAIEIIKKRRSVRTYAKKTVDQEKKDIIKKELEKVKGQKFRFEMIDFKLEEGIKLGTYGMIKGASTFMVGILNKESMDDNDVAVDFGYAFEGIVLRATELGLGTCWLAGTFNSKDALKMVVLKEKEQIVMVSPLGYGDKMRVMEKIGRRMAKSDQRKPWQELFFDQSFDKPLSKEEAGQYTDVLDMVRLAPSAANKQPWRILKTDTTYDFYNAKASSSDKKGQKYDVSYNDLGIAKSHFEYSAKEKGLDGHWVKKNNNMEEKFAYVCSWKFSNL